MPAGFFYVEISYGGQDEKGTGDDKKNGVQADDDQVGEAGDGLPCSELTGFNQLNKLMVMLYKTLQTGQTREDE